MPRPARRVDIVVPVYNEQGGVERSIHRLHAFLSDGFPFAWRIVIADNASTDDTLTIARRLAVELPHTTVLHLAAKGRGRALRAAWTASDAEVLAYMDVDLSTDLRALHPLVASLFSGHGEVAIGTRLARGSRVVRSTERELISRSYNRVLRLALGARFSDAQCGFKAIRADAARELLPTIQDTGWFFDTELLVAAQRRGMRIHEVAVDWVDDGLGAGRVSSVAIAPTALADLRGVLRLRFDSVLPRFLAIGAVSTAAYALLYLLLRGALGAVAANAVALALHRGGQHPGQPPARVSDPRTRRARPPARGRSGRLPARARADRLRARRAAGPGPPSRAAAGGRRARRREPRRDLLSLRRAAHVGLPARRRRRRPGPFAGHARALSGARRAPVEVVADRQPLPGARYRRARWHRSSPSPDTADTARVGDGPPPPTPPARRWRHPRQTTAVSVAYVAGMFMSAMDMHIVNVALPTLSRDFGDPLTSVQWTVIAYLLTLAVLIPASGWIGDRIGNKRTFVFALVVFTLASALCGLAQNLGELIAARALQGVGGGMLTPMGTAMLYRAFPPERRAAVARTLIVPVLIGPGAAPGRRRDLHPGRLLALGVPRQRPGRDRRHRLLAPVPRRGPSGAPAAGSTSAGWCSPASG